jgi:N-acetylglutamate synthase-like GNAT family acetyltransferase
VKFETVLSPENNFRQNQPVHPTTLRIRRATVDDLAALRAIWLSMRLDAEALENRLTEFQVAERRGEVLGAVAFQIVRTAGLMHSEGFSDFSVADEARKLFWDRLQSVAANHGVFRLWTQETSPFWLRWGFQPAGEEDLARLPDEWKKFEGGWFTLELKNEALVTAALEKHYGEFSAEEKRQSAEATACAKTFSNLIAAFFFIIGFGAIGFAVWLFIRFKSSGH